MAPAAYSGSDDWTSSSSSSAHGSDDGFPWQYVVVPIIAFFCELIDSALGMGYGTTLTPILLTPSFGFPRSVIVQSVLVSEAATGILATVFHAFFKNMNIGLSFHKRLPKGLKRVLFGKDDEDYLDDGKGGDKKDIEIKAVPPECADPQFLASCTNTTPPPSDSPVAVPVPSSEEEADKKDDDAEAIDIDKDEKEAHEELKKIDLATATKWQKIRFYVRKHFTIDLQIIAILAFTGICGTIVSAAVGSFDKAYQKFAVKIYIGVMVICMGVLMIIFTAIKFRMKYRWWLIAILGSITGFNKGISGGGYGPIAVSGQVILGRPNRNAIGVTSAAECIISISGVVMDFIVAGIKGDKAIAKSKKNYNLVPFLLIGALLSVPFAAFFTRRIQARFMRYVVGVVTIMLGCYTIIAASLSYTGVWKGG